MPPRLFLGCAAALLFAAALNSAAVAQSELAAAAPDAGNTVVVRPDTASPAQAAPAAGLNEVICRSVAPATGTRLGAHEECHQKHVWDERMHNDQATVQKQQNFGFFWQPKGPGGH